MSEHTLAILVKAIGAGKAAKDLKGVDKAVANIGAHSGKGLRTAATNIARIGVIGAGVAAAGIVAAVKAAGDFEAQLNTINTVAGLSSTALATVGSDIRGVARDTGASLSDLTGAYYDLVSAGIKPGADALKVLKLANTLAIGGLATTGQTVDLLTTAINTYGLDARGAAKATDQFAEAIALGKVTAAQLAESFAIVGPLAQSSGIGINEIAASYAQLTAKGVPAAEAATEMRSAMVALVKPTAAMSAAQKKLGVNFAQIAKNKGLVTALAMVRRYSEKTGIPLAKLMGRIEGVNYVLSTTGANAAGYANALKQVDAANGTAAQQMAERQKGLNYELARLKALALDAGITIGSKLIPKMIPLADRAVKFLETHQSDISAFGDTIAGAFDKAVKLAEKIPWGAIGAGLQTASEWAGRLMDAFASLPPGAQSTIIALAGLNKLSGGAIGSIVSDLGSGLIKGVLGMTAGIVNIKAGVVNGGGGGNGLPGGGAAGAAGTAAGAAEGIAPAVAPMGAAALFATTLSGGLLFGLADRITKGIEDGIISTLPAAVQSGVSQAASGSRTQAFGGIEGGLNFLSDPGASINKMTDAVNQLSGFINAPHPDFLGDLGKLAFLQYQAPTPGATPRDMDKNPYANGPASRDSEKSLPSSKAVLSSLKRMNIDLDKIARQRRDGLRHPVQRRDMDRGGHDGLQSPKDVFASLKKDGINLGSIAQRRLDSLKQSQDQTKAATRDMDKNLGSDISQTRNTVASSANATSGAVRSGTSGTTAAVNVMGARISGALGAVARAVPVVNVNVSPTTISNTTVINQRTGTVSGSRGGIKLGR